MLLLSLSPWRSFVLRHGRGYPIPRGATVPDHNEVILLARRRWTSRGVEHWIHTAIRATALKLPVLHPLRGRTRWVIARVNCWKLTQPFLLEGIQLTPTDYVRGPSLQRLDGQDAGEITRRRLLQGKEEPEAVVFEHEPSTPADDALRGLFHKLWGRAAEHDDYLKVEWGQLYGMLEERHVFKYPPRKEKVG